MGKYLFKLNNKERLQTLFRYLFIGIEQVPFRRNGNTKDELGNQIYFSTKGVFKLLPNIYDEGF